MKVLFVSWHCRNGTAEGLASARLAEALARHGHEVTLLTTTEPGLEGVSVHRVEPDPPGAFDRLSRRMDRWGRVGALPHLLRGCTVEEAGWVRAVARRAPELGPFDVIHSRLNPAVSHLAAMAVLDTLDLPWCAYFSDPWPHHLYPEPYRFTVGPLSRHRQERALDAMLRRAGSLVFPSARLRDWLLAGSRKRYRPKSLVAPHLAGEVAPSPAHRRNRGRDGEGSSLRIRHAGFLMKERRVEPLFAGLERFLSAHPDAPIRVEFAGRYAGPAPTVPPSLAGVVSFEPSMPPDAVPAWMAEADVALLVEANLEEGVFFPSKLSDYLIGGRPILALSPSRGVAADFLASGGGVLAGPEDPAGIAAALGRLYDLWRAGRLAELAPNPEQAAAVSPASVVPLYERAFLEAGR
ncbi:MAG: glycosyltransferase [Acidobacteriota bacterium]